MTESLACEKARIPAANKYKTNYDFIMKKVPFYAKLDRSTGRDLKVYKKGEKKKDEKKSKAPGPGSYLTEVAADKVMARAVHSISLSGFGIKHNMAHGDISHAEKVKRNKSRSYLDEMFKGVGKTPGACHYKGVANGMDKISRGPRSLRPSRH
jgi:hypothetical protein